MTEVQSSASGGIGRYSSLDIEQVAEFRSQGLSWAEIGRRMGRKSPGLRQTYLRRTNPAFLEHDRVRSRNAARKRRLQLQAILAEAKDRPCIDCGVRLPMECMELDHVRGEKAFAVGHKFQGAGYYVSIPDIVAEIAKCEVRCPNCHRLRHYRERFAKGTSPQMKLAV